MRKKKSMRTGEAAEYLDVSKASITNWVRSGQLKASTTPGGHYIFTREILDEFALVTRQPRDTIRRGKDVRHGRMPVERSGLGNQRNQAGRLPVG